MKTKILLVMFAGLAFCQAQISVNASGAEGSSTSGSIAASVGEVLYTSASGGSYSVSAGVQQSFVVTVLGTSNPNLSLDLKVYPNPAISELYLSYPAFIANASVFELFDAAGKIIKSGKIKDTETKIDMSMYPSAMYILRVSGDKQTIKIFKIIKK